ncbi:MAG: class I adenylate-forming enzyme family protein [Pseudomonadota bacterium]
MTKSAEDMLASEFATFSDLIRAHGRDQPGKTAVICGEASMDYAALDRMADRIAASLQRDGLGKGDAVAIVSLSSIDYACVFIGALRAGCVPAPLQPSATHEQLAAMIGDCGAPILFHDAGHDVNAPVRKVALEALQTWLSGETPQPVEIAPGDPFNIIYSSGTTGTPKGIVQPHSMRWAHISRAAAGFGDAVTMIVTPLYSNTTLVSFIPTLAWGGTVVLIPKFDAAEFLRLAEKHRATHVMLVPVQYQRIMALRDFDAHDLSSFRFKTCTSAPFSAALKADVVARWPGYLVEYYGMTEGGGTCALVCNAHLTKLHTVGVPVDGHDIRLIDDNGNEVAQGEMGEVVGRSPAMMTGYHGRKDASSDAEWFDADGNRFIRHGDVGRFDEDGFLQLLDRKKDMIISGGFNLYPSDLETILIQHPDVSDCSVVGVPSEAWGETPVGFYAGAGDTAEIFAWFNAQVGKTQRLSALEHIAELPRNAIGKVLKRELRDRYLAT